MDGGDGAGDGGSFDACECIYSHQAGMQRLISYLRQAQSDCTDSECFNETPGSRDSTQASDPSNYTGILLMFTWLMIALVLYFMRPAAMRRGDQGKGNNDRNSHQDGDHMPPAPPVM
ncbi:small integral membrane protein 14-like [Paramacrobiotus metropolitanus]|uniref:small integral membrane protein 14-like n=1 Tax=Paramacrobiotus metropolitanus TaxID=2943436 RepID=UPI002445DF87|nr:small integral membrane protein 14-like [Paramacrobiotus metropolitanus]